MTKGRVNGGGQGADPGGNGFDWRDWLDPRRVGWLRMLMVFVPVAIALDWSGAPASWQFMAAMVAILPLAAVMGEATEHLAHRAGPGVGGLLNATFGNAAELIIALAMLFKGPRLDEVVKASLIGSILGNILLVLGASMFAGGLKYRIQKFNRTAAGVASTMMCVAAIGMLVPAIFHALPEVVALNKENALNLEHKLSVAVGGFLMLGYVLTLVFSLKTHKDLFNPKGEALDHEHPGGECVGGVSAWRSTTTLLIATVFVAMVSEVLAGAIEETGEKWGLTRVFLGVIVVATVGNAAEHSSAVMVALKNKMDLAVGIAMGSALQISLFVAPMLVFTSYLRSEPMDLLFSTMEIVAVILGVIIARMIAEDGESNWLEGAMLLMIYAILGVAFFVLPEVAHHPVGVGTPNP